MAGIVRSLAGALKDRSFDQASERFRANGSRERAPDDRLRGYRFA
jgi:hypothetical protein